MTGVAPSEWLADPAAAAAAVLILEKQAADLEKARKRTRRR